MLVCLYIYLLYDIYLIKKMSIDKRFAILIGSNRYKEKNLNYSTKDALDFKYILNKKCKFENENIIIITPELTNDYLVIDELNKAFEKIIELGFIKNSSCFLFYYSGHGIYDKDENSSYLDFSDDEKIKIQDVLNKIHDLEAKNSFMIIDSCESGAELDLSSRKSKAERQLSFKSSGIYCLFSSSKNLYSYEPNDEESKKYKIQNSFLTHFIIEVLNREEKYEDGLISMKEIDGYVSLKTTKLKNFTQIPVSQSNSSGFFPFGVWDKNSEHLFDNKAKDIETDVEDTINEDSTLFFSSRIRSSFPGTNNLVWFYDPEEAIYRLSLLLSPPITFKKRIGFNVSLEPIWWWRGHRCLQINKFEKLSKTKCLINTQEFEINKIAVYRDPAYYREFVYVEVNPETPIGLYKYNMSEEEEKLILRLNDYLYEEYAILDGIPIKREEYDDGHAVINGKVVKAYDAQLRVRFLSKYNFIISAQMSPYNSRKGDRLTQKYLNGIINGIYSLEDFISEVQTLTRNERD